MLITAKYPSKCGACRGPISPGARVEWTKGSPAVHASCASGSATTTTSRSPARSPRPARSSGARSPRKPVAPRQQYREPAAGETVIQRRASGGYVVGSTIHTPKVAGGGGPDGCYWHVTFAWFSPEDEDNQQFEDRDVCYAIPATDEQVAPVLAQIAERSARPLCEAWLASALAHGAPGVTTESDTGELPADAERLELAPGVTELVLGRKIGSSGATVDGGTTYVVTAAAIVAHHGGYYDDYRSSTRTLALTSDEDHARLVALIRALVAKDVPALVVYADRARELGVRS